MRKKNFLILIIGILFCTSPMIMAQNGSEDQISDKLVVIWTSGDPYVAERVAFMYTHNANFLAESHAQDEFIFQ